jgi:hypothetical protein
MATMATGEAMMSPKTIASEVTTVTGGSVTSLRSTVETGHKMPVAKVRPPPSLQRCFVVVYLMGKLKSNTT